MAEGTKIEWCEHTFNPWIGCTRVSPGCVHCYAESFAKRYNKAEWGPTAARVRTSAAYWKKPLKWNKEEWWECTECTWRGLPPMLPAYCPWCGCQETRPTKQRVFCASMADVFEDNPQTRNWLWDLGQLIIATPNLDWLLLTKRPENVMRLIEECMGGEIAELWLERQANIWIGTSVEDQKRADERIPELLKIPAKVKFLSVEPMLEKIDVVQAVNQLDWLHPAMLRPNGIDWVICGGESGAGCRPMEIEWAQDLREQCKRAEVPFFMKQLGGHPNKRHDLDDFPENLRVREWPALAPLPSASPQIESDLGGEDPGVCSLGYDMGGG